MQGRGLWMGSTLSLQVLRGRRGAWVPCISVHLVYRVLCHLMQYTCPIILLLISGLQTFKGSPKNLLAAKQWPRLDR